MRACRIAVAASVAAVLLGAPPVGAEAQGNASWSATWTDPRGDAGSAPDITAVQLGVDAHQDVLIRVFAPTPVNDPARVLRVFVTTASRPGDPPPPGDPALFGANFQLVYSYNERKASVEEWDESTKTWYRSGLIYSTPLDQRLWPVLVTPDSTTFAVPNYYFADSESSGTIRVFVRLGTSQQYDQAPDTGRYD